MTYKVKIFIIMMSAMSAAYALGENTPTATNNDFNKYLPQNDDKDAWLRNQLLDTGGGGQGGNNGSSTQKDSLQNYFPQNNDDDDFQNNLFSLNKNDDLLGPLVYNSEPKYYRTPYVLKAEQSVQNSSENLENKKQAIIENEKRLSDVTSSLSQKQNQLSKEKKKLKTINQQINKMRMKGDKNKEVIEEIKNHMGNNPLVQPEQQPEKQITSNQTALMPQNNNANGTPVSGTNNQIALNNLQNNPNLAQDIRNALKQPAAKQPTVNQSAVKQSAVNQSTVNQSALKQLTAKQSAVNQSTVKQPGNQSVNPFISTTGSYADLLSLNAQGTNAQSSKEDNFIASLKQTLQRQAALERERMKQERTISQLKERISSLKAQKEKLTEESVTLQSDQTILQSNWNAAQQALEKEKALSTQVKLKPWKAPSLVGARFFLKEKGIAQSTPEQKFAIADNIDQLEHIQKAWQAMKEISEKYVNSNKNAYDIINNDVKSVLDQLKALTTNSKHSSIYDADKDGQLSHEINNIKRQAVDFIKNFNKTARQNYRTLGDFVNDKDSQILKKYNKDLSHPNDPQYKELGQEHSPKNYVVNKWHEAFRTLNHTLDVLKNGTDWKNLSKPEELKKLVTTSTSPHGSENIDDQSFRAIRKLIKDTAPVWQKVERNNKQKIKDEKREDAKIPEDFFHL
jgi:hypothetical protein